MDGDTWFRDAIIYHILIDRFAGFSSTDGWNEPEFLGGTIKGIIEKLPYLKELGVNTLWISPFYTTSAYHGYHITDFNKVDPHFGTKEELRDLITIVHEHDMKILADFVPNHCSNQHPFFLDAQREKTSPYYDWFSFTSWPNEYVCFLSVKELPKLNLKYPPARKHVISSAKSWLAQGLDGFRLDHIIGPPHSFWREFNKEIKEDFPHTVLIGEAWMMGISFRELRTINVHHKFFKWFRGTTSDSLFKEYIGEVDGVLDFKFQELIKHYAWDKLSQQELERAMQRRYAQYPQDFFLPTFLDNHDMDRFLFSCGNNVEKLKAAATLQFSLDQPPIIYYGTEQGMTQTTSVWAKTPYGDLQARTPMFWGKHNKALFTFYQQLIQQRQKLKALI